jgi:hypothetical protein
MKVSRLLVCAVSVCALASASWAQEKKATDSGERAAEGLVVFPGPERPVRRVVVVKNRDIIGELTLLARDFGVSARGSGELGVITLMGPEEAVAIAEDTIRRFDVPRANRPERSPRNADFTVYLVVAGLEGKAAPVPEVLESVVAQLRGLLPYEHYGLIETVRLRVADQGRGKVMGFLPPLSTRLSGKTLYELTLQNVRLPGEGAGRPPAGWVSVQPVLETSMSLTEEGVEKNVPSAINSSIEIQEGQKVVVGKAAIDGAGTSLILVLTMKLDR